MNHKPLSLWMLAGAGLILALAAYLRLSGLENKSITHPEMYVPGIHLPEGISEPRERLTFTRVITSTASTSHPPAYFVFMLAWTKFFGTKLSTLRLPSALLGIACIPLLYWLGALAGNRTAAAVGAALLSVNGFHISYSQLAKNHLPACLLGLLSTVLLLLTARRRGGRTTLWAYALLTAAGMATHHFFWALFVTQMLWAGLYIWRGKGELPAVVRTQLLLLIVGSPLIAVAAYQSGGPNVPPGGSVFSFLFEYIQFGFFYPSQTLPRVLGTGLFLFSAVLLLAGLMRPWSEEEERLPLDQGGPSVRAWVAATVVAVSAIAILVAMAKAFADPQPYPSIRLAGALAVLPCALLGLAVWLDRRSRRSVDRRERPPCRDGRILIGMLALLPVAILASAALYKPIHNARGALIFTPYLLLAIAAGVTALARNRWMMACMGVLLIGMHAASVKLYGAYTIEADYRRLATELSSRVERGDLIFLRKRWDVTPVLYYLPESRYQLVGRDYRAACRAHPKARVWTIAFYEKDIAREMREALSQYQPVQAIEIPNGKAILYQPS